MRAPGQREKGSSVLIELKKYLGKFMKEIKLTRGKIALVDDEDYYNLMYWSWCATPNRGKYYAKRATIKNGKYKMIPMSNTIMNPPEGMIVDHIDHNGLNNQKSNLRTCTYSQNCVHAIHKKTKTGYRGVYEDKRYFLRNSIRKYRIELTVNMKRKSFGTFTDPKEAARVYNELTKKYNGEFALLNIID
jgi:hypothetical protein